jgi:hypothetical protein
VVTPVMNSGVRLGTDSDGCAGPRDPLQEARRGGEDPAVPTASTAAASATRGSTPSSRTRSSSQGGRARTRARSGRERTEQLDGTRSRD